MSNPKDIAPAVIQEAAVRVKMALIGIKEAIRVEREENAENNGRAPVRERTTQKSLSPAHF